MSKTKKIIWAIGISGTLGVVLVGSYFIARIYMDGRLPAGTSISGTNLAYSTVDDAIKILDEKTEAFLSNEITFELDGTTASISPGDLSIEIYTAESVQLIEEASSQKNSVFKFFFPSDNRKADLLVSIDEDKLISELDKNLLLSDIAPQPANFYFDENDTLAISAEKDGLALDKEKLIKDIKEKTKNLANNQIQLKVDPKTPDLKVQDLEGQLEGMNATIARSFILNDPVYSDPWTVSLAENKSWVDFVPNEEAKTVAIKINQEGLNAFVDEEISQWLDDPVDPVNIYKDENGESIIEGRGHNGMEIQRIVLKDSIEVAVANNFEEITVPIKEIIPELNITDELKDLGVIERIGVGHTSFYGSPANRIHNIKVGAAQMNGSLIAPGETFSFNTKLGPVDGTTGYRKELVIKKEGTIPEFGGGICQVSTTMYRAVLFSGLEISERNQHSYAVSYYSQVLGHGLDATIYLGGPDLKFTNDTEGHILVQAYTKDDYELYFVFYGTSDGRSVELDGPYLSNYHSPGGTQYIDSAKLAPGQQKQVEIPHVGFTADWYRYITDAEGNTDKEYLPTNYRAIPAKILVGVDPNAESSDS